MAARQQEPAADHHFDFHVIDGPEGDMNIEMHAEGETVAMAHVRNDVLADMQSLLGSMRAEVRTHVEEALTRRFE